MKVQVNEYNSGFNIELKPETMEEQALLLRITSNAKRESFNISSHFGKSIYTSIWGSLRKNICNNINNLKR